MPTAIGCWAHRSINIRVRVAGYDGAKNRWHMANVRGLPEIECDDHPKSVQPADDERPVHTPTGEQGILVI